MSGSPSVTCDHVLSAAERTRDANLERAERRGLTPEQLIEQFSRPEIELMKAFMEQGFEPLQQYPIGPWDADFYFPEFRVAVEVDGAHHFEKEQWFKDRRRDRVFWKRYGIRTLRVPARYVNQVFGAAICARTVIAELTAQDEATG